MYCILLLSSIASLTPPHHCQVNLLEAANKKSSELSGGMRRRLSVAMACIGNPDILILGQCIIGLRQQPPSWDGALACNGWEGVIN